MRLRKAILGAPITALEYRRKSVLVKADIVNVISKYMKIDTANMDIQISKSTPALYANIPILDLNKQ